MPSGSGFDSLHLRGRTATLVLRGQGSLGAGGFGRAAAAEAARIFDSLWLDHATTSDLLNYWNRLQRPVSAPRSALSKVNLRTEVSAAIRNGQLTAEVLSPSGSPSAASGAAGTSGVDVDKAIAYLNTHISAKQWGEGACAAFVRRAIDAGGGGKLEPPPDGNGYAKNFGPQLIEAGYVEVEVPSNYPDDKTLQQKGDVVVIQPYGDGPAGHMTMYNGSRWVSDFVQTDMWGGPTARAQKPVFKVYRP